jgi:hypothetical protein
MSTGKAIRPWIRADASDSGEEIQPQKGAKKRNMG